MEKQRVGRFHCEHFQGVIRSVMISATLCEHKLFFISYDGPSMICHYGSHVTMSHVNTACPTAILEDWPKHSWQPFCLKWLNQQVMWMPHL